jgi:hypothetical protein
MIHRKVTLSAPTTTLAGMLADQPYLAYKPGQGINALTGQPCVSALMPFEVTGFPPFNVTERIERVESVQSFQNIFNVEVGGSYNMEGVNLSASAQFLHDVSYSQSSLTFVATYEIVCDGPGNPSDAPEFSPEAREVLDQSAEKFRERYGDYYVSSWTSGARFIGIYTCQAATSKSLTEFKASMSAEVPDVMSANGAAAFTRKTEENQISYSCKYLMQGTKHQPPHFDNTPEGIALALAWFKENAETGEPSHLQFVPRKATLTHYAQLSNKVLLTLQIDPTVFAEIQVLRFYVVQAQSLLKGLPPFFGRQKSPTGETFDAAIIQLTKEFEAGQASLPTNTAMREKLMKNAKEICAALEAPSDVYSFYESLVNSDHGDGGQSGKYTKEYGFTNQTQNLPKEVLVQTWDQTISHTYDFWKDAGRKQKHTFLFSDQGKLIVGWKIFANWGDGLNGSFSGGGMIGKHQGEVTVEGEVDRGFNWSLQVYYVDMKVFPWVS